MPGERASHSWRVGPRDEDVGGVRKVPRFSCLEGQSNENRISEVPREMRTEVLLDVGMVLPLETRPDVERYAVVGNSNSRCTRVLLKRVGEPQRVKAPLVLTLREGTRLHPDIPIAGNRCRVCQRVSSDVLEATVTRDGLSGEVRGRDTRIVQKVVLGEARFRRVRKALRQIHLE